MAFDQSRPPRRGAARPSDNSSPGNARPRQKPMWQPRQRPLPTPREDLVDSEQLAFFNEHAVPLAKPWDEDKTRFQEVLVLTGESYQPPRLFDVAPINTDPGRVPDSHAVFSPQRKFGYMNRLLRRARGLPLYQNQKQGIVLWTSDVIIPVLFDGLTREVWMSLTPMEILSEREGIAQAKGTVLVGGLGMGHFLQKICAKSTVERVILVESSQELLDWYGHRICQALPKVTDVICGDVYDHLGKFGPQCRYLLDIWPQYGDAALDERFQAAKQEIPGLWGWGDYLVPDLDEYEEFE